MSVTVVISLANLLCQVWKIADDRQQKTLDRDQQMRIHQERMRHELLMQMAKAVETTEYSLDVSSSPFLERLRLEAEILFQFNYTVVYESVDNGYGVALPIDSSYIIAFWLSSNYPSDAPVVYLCSETEISQITFEDRAWNKERSLAEVITAFTKGTGEQI